MRDESSQPRVPTDDRFAGLSVCRNTQVAAVTGRKQALTDEAVDRTNFDDSGVQRPKLCDLHDKWNVRTCVADGSRRFALPPVLGLCDRAGVRLLCKRENWLSFVARLRLRIGLWQRVVQFP